MKKSFCFLALLALQFSDAAGNTEPAGAPASPAAPANVLEIKNKSSFLMDEGGRNPFWPIGWKPSAKKSSQIESPGPEIRATAFLVSSITMDPTARFAIINGKVMGEGQVFGLQLGGQTYQLSVKAIQDGRVILLRREQEIVVALRRK